MSKIYNNIRKLCIENGDLKIYQLENALGIGNGTIGKWKTYDPTPENLEKVADFFGVSVEEITGENENGSSITAVGTYETDLIKNFRLLSEVGKMKIMLATLQEIEKEKQP